MTRTKRFDVKPVVLTILFAIVVGITLTTLRPRYTTIEAYRIPKASSAAPSGFSTPAGSSGGSMTLPPDHPELPEGHPEIPFDRMELPPGHPEIPDTLPAMPPATAGQPAMSMGVTWQAPAHWEERPASGMRLGSFLIRGEHGAEADLSVIRLSGGAGGLIPNLNRWRGQLNLAPVSPEEAADHLEDMTLGGHPVTLADIVSEEPTADGAPRQRILAAIVPHGESQYFFKMTGEASLIERERTALLKFLETVEFAE